MIFLLRSVPIGDDGQLMSCRWPVLWLSTHAVQPPVSIGDDGQLLSAAGPSNGLVQMQYNRQPVKGLPSSVLLQVFSVKRFPSRVFRQECSGKCFP